MTKQFVWTARFGRTDGPIMRLGRWMRCKYCYSTVKPEIRESDLSVIFCSKCDYHISLPEFHLFCPRCDEHVTTEGGTQAFAKEYMCEKCEWHYIETEENLKRWKEHYMQPGHHEPLRMHYMGKDYVIT